MNAFTNYLEKLGGNFLVAAMIPSLALVIGSVLMFNPALLVPVAKTLEDPKEVPQLVGLSLIIFLLTVIIGFTLTTLNTYILKVFEGYIIFPPIRFLYNKSLRIHQKKALNLLEHRDRLEEEYTYLYNFCNHDPGMQEKRNPALEERLEQILDKHYQIAGTYDERYPANPDLILPTEFGNKLRAAEDHATQRYGFDGVLFWPRLIHVVPDSYKAMIDSTRNQLSFLVNMSILSAVFSFLCILAIPHTWWITDIAGNSPAIATVFVGNIVKYLLAAGLGVVLCGFFYNASMISLSSYTLAIRASFDLFRLDLLKKLEIERPGDFNKEFETWKNLNEMIVLGNRSLTFKPFRYRPEDKEQ
jgi:hypothetical protein